jgi:hypothetical protein
MNVLRDACALTAAFPSYACEPSSKLVHLLDVVQTVCSVHDVGSLQGVRMNATCISPHSFHDALVDSDLVTKPIKKYTQQYCSTLSFQTAKGRHSVQLSFGALLAGTTLRCSQVGCQYDCLSQASSCDSLCSAAVVVTLSPSVLLWNKLFPFLSLAPAGVSTSGCTEVTMSPRTRWKAMSNGVLRSLNG